MLRRMDAPVKILIVEDDPIVTTVYERQFTMRGYTVEVAADGELGLEALRRGAPDLVLLDLQLPKVSGIEVLKFIRATPNLKNVPVIVFTNAYLGTLVDQAWKAGANKCLTKAFTPAKQLIEVIAAALHSTPPLPPPRATPVPAAKPDEAAFLSDFQKKFLAQGTSFVAELRASLMKFVKGDTDPSLTALEDRLALLSSMARTTHTLTGSAGIAGFERIADVSSALEALIEELLDDPKNITQSMLRTLASAVDLFSALFAAAGRAAPMTSVRPRILVVDDEATSRRAVVAGLEKAGLKADAMADPFLGLELALKTHYDLIFLDIEMPGMDGFDLCARLRNEPGYEKTPVIFVTVLNDFQTRARSIMSGANDLIAKPFLLIELAVKALIHVHKGQLQNESA